MPREELLNPFSLPLSIPFMNRHYLFIHSVDDGYLYCFLFLLSWIVLLWSFFYMSTSALGYMPRSGIARSWRNHMLNLWRKAKLFLKVYSWMFHASLRRMSIIYIFVVNINLVNSVAQIIYPLLDCYCLFQGQHTVAHQPNLTHSLLLYSPVN